MGGKTSSVSARIDDFLRARLTAISQRYGPSDATMLEDALSALADYVEVAGKYERPMKMIFDAEAAGELRQRAAEGGPRDDVPTALERAEREKRAARAARDKGRGPARGGGAKGRGTV